MSDYMFNDHDGHRGSTQISGVTYADLYDFIYYLTAPEVNDPDALCQQVCVEVEKAQGIYPNIEVEKAPAFNDLTPPNTPSSELMVCLEHLERVRTGAVDTWVTKQAGYFELSVLSNALFADRLVVQEKQQ